MNVVTVKAGSPLTITDRVLYSAIRKTPPSRRNVSALARVTGLSRPTIYKGLDKLRTLDLVNGMDPLPPRPEYGLTEKYGKDGKPYYAYVRAKLPPEGISVITAVLIGTVEAMIAKGITVSVRRLSRMAGVDRRTASKHLAKYPAQAVPVGTTVAAPAQAVPPAPPAPGSAVREREGHHVAVQLVEEPCDGFDDLLGEMRATFTDATNATQYQPISPPPAQELTVSPDPEPAPTATCVPPAPPAPPDAAAPFAVLTFNRGNPDHPKGPTFDVVLTLDVLDRSWPSVLEDQSLTWVHHEFWRYVKTYKFDPDQAVTILSAVASGKLDGEKFDEFVLACNKVHAWNVEHGHVTINYGTAYYVWQKLQASGFYVTPKMEATEAMYWATRKTRHGKRVQMDDDQDDEVDMYEPANKSDWF